MRNSLSTTDRLLAKDFADALKKSMPWFGRGLFSYAESPWKLAKRMSEAVDPANGPVGDFAAR